MITNKKIKIDVPEKLGLSEKSFEQSWEIIKHAIDHIYGDDTAELSFEQVYRTVYTIVLNRKGLVLYNKLKTYIIQKLSLLRETICKNSARDYEMLETMVRLWETQCNCFKIIGDLMMYMDKVYCKPNRCLEVYDMCLDLFRVEILHKCSSFLISALISDIEEIRNLGSLDSKHTNLWKVIIGMMETLHGNRDSFFLTDFEPVLISATEEYYDKIIDIKLLTPIDSLEKIKQLKQFEDVLDSSFLNADSHSKLKTVLENVLIWGKLSDIIEDLTYEAMELLDEKLLQEIYDLSSEEKYRFAIIEAIKSYISKSAIKIPLKDGSRKKGQNAITWSSEVVNLFRKQHLFLKSINFGSIQLNNLAADKSIAILEDVFSMYFSKEESLSSEYFSTYVDYCMKRAKDNDVEMVTIKQDLLDSTRLIKLLSKKDTFEKTYRKQLSRRLLQQRSVVEIEKWTVQMIKKVLGAFFTSKLEIMLRDVSLSSEILQGFKDSMTNSIEYLSFVPQVLTRISWPFQSSNPIDEIVSLPPRMSQVLAGFEGYYSSRYKERVLKWAHHLSVIEIGCQFNTGYYEISFSVYAGAIFLLFEDYEELTLKEIYELTHIPEEYVKSLVISMSTVPRCKILKKSSNSGSTKFSVNYFFSSSNRKVKVPVIAGPVLSHKSENLANHNLVDTYENEIIMVLSATIVRVMKTEGRLSHQRLLEIVTKQTLPLFDVTPSIFKRGIQLLLEKEYIQRDADDTSYYHYLS
ncbi:hypothetical protein SMKI_07G2500 [Saccharomyces mikatae IFO 1815]|uniref:Cullin family profile domain-containing protein n=1 Tax=Saccharomyces mikatae IFO 1815 TaxID=226126 RepID=A0AA35NIH9_SACMI|nr:uncharacterized protein SMKI_07G2500 [Saccharomyces mikatae IFO 1815]CAI4039270.1 hypothetical protein SMKI_07G2500 [Saccharomyces mikatae IFO 1815]